ncbi:diguanylate phosphodiesterase [Denitrovibrio acetiphilus DSM 12809]|uniref:Diguanylate phosphodiesterase n=1 Tax=Denitrovibrio acetiphilus (strain DSM 12809 / NBRC 114555 / N2460) TaxID=522772 RepID=D4H0I4_DENA2|nr:EAL domain-containing protein [Denitrovibrio acetiphilus]ADD68497.1 diguanylate phosphodiesterase [Denitrovibrio acetiphilus DSM 12809]
MLRDIDIHNIIAEKNVVTLFQPVISLREKRIIAFEALTRGICSETGAIIHPMELFSAAKAENCSTELDRLCRKNALKAFKTIPDHEKYILFINFDTTAIEANDPDVKRITQEYTDEQGLDYSSISIEIVESKIDNQDNLADFVDHYRKLGYYVSLDDFGAMHSNMNRIIVSKPDIIKIDMELIKDVHLNYYQQSILSSIIDLAKKTGALTLAEGLEAAEDIVTCYELGIDLYQGFYFFRPCIDIQGNYPFIETRIDYLVMLIKNKLKENVLIRKNQHLSFDFIINILKEGAQDCDVENYIKFLSQQITNFDEIERVFLLDESGHQPFKSISNICINSKKQRSFLMMHEYNADHSLKDYFYYLDKIESDRFYTETYLSSVTGKVLRTMSSRMEIQSKKYVLCVEFVDTVSAQKHYNRSAGELKR